MTEFFVFVESYVDGNDAHKNLANVPYMAASNAGQHSRDESVLDCVVSAGIPHVVMDKM